MALVPLTQGAYKARSIIANAQRCVNLFPESNTPDAPFPFTFYQRPGLASLSQAPNYGRARGLYTASDGTLFAASGNKLYWVDSGFIYHEIGTIEDGLKPVCMIDNGNDLVVGTGSPEVGYKVNLMTKAMTTLSIADNWLGAVGAGYIDTFMVFSQPASKNYFSSLSNVVTFDPLYIAAKTGRPDLLQTLIVVHREIWLVGTKTTEVWFNAGAANFPFAEQQGVFIEHGTIAPYSVVSHGLVVFCLSQDKDGRAIVNMITAYEAKRISTYAIESEFAKYPRLDDCIAQTYQIEGHVFVVFNFPTADKTWVFDMMEGLWHEETWCDVNGIEHRSRVGFTAYAYGRVVAADWQTSQLYTMSLDVVDDNQHPIVCRRGFPHMYNEGNRVSYLTFEVDMEVGNLQGGVQYYQQFDFNNDFNDDFNIFSHNTLFPNDASVFLRWSNTAGRTWGNPVPQTLGRTGEYATTLQWNRLGMARDRVFELFWAVPTKTALNGAAITVLPFTS